MTWGEIIVYGLLALIVLIALAACSGLKVDGSCVYTREVKTSYQCQPDGKLEHYRVEPEQ